MIKATLYLNAEQLALLFTQLHRLESAGLSCNQAFSILSHSEVKLKKTNIADSATTECGSSGF
jgi:type II secretory pathway component PulF